MTIDIPMAIRKRKGSNQELVVKSRIIKIIGTAKLKSFAFHDKHFAEQ